jgi:hypothetical protein
MNKVHFIGLTITKPLNTAFFDNFNGTIVDWKKIRAYGQTEYCLFYRGKCSSNDLDESIVKLNKKEMQQLINDLEMVESKELYDSYNDNFGYHCLQTDPKKLVLKRKLKI